MHVDFRKRSQSDIRATATPTPVQREQILSEPKGDVGVAVQVTDDAGNEPITCEMIWAWIPKKRQ